MEIEYNQNIIEETIENYETRNLIELFYSNKVSIENNKLIIDYDTVGKELGLSNDLCKELYGIKDSTAIHIFYKNENLPSSYRIIEVEDSQKKKELYRIYRYKYCLDLINIKKKFLNPFIVNDKKIMQFSELEKLFLSSIQYFKIIDSKMINFLDIFQRNETINLSEITGLSYSENFNYYFKYPNSQEKFIYEYSPNRTNLFELGEREKIRAISGNFGIGKSTSFLSAKISYPETIYFNLKALIENKNDVFVWKYKILLREIASSFKRTSSYETFLVLKEKIENQLLIWESIISVVDFVLKKNIKTKLILDQYKESYDENYNNIKTIINLISKNKENQMKLIISSSINNKDVRDSLLKSWFKDFFKEKPLFEYIYFSELFNSDKLINNDNTLSNQKKDFIKKYFNNIPRFYYDIKYLDNNKLNEYKEIETKKIDMKIRKFYEIHNLSIENIITLLNYRQRIGKVLELKELFNLLKILPLKYFTLNNRVINFYFPIVETAFDNYLSDRICEILKFPIIGIKGSSIGNLLEYVLINDLKNNRLEAYDEVLVVNSIWNLNEIENPNNNNIGNKDILILQIDPNAKYFDFGILNKGDKLLLIQCKKALVNKPKDYPTKELIYENRDKINKIFSSKFNVKIKYIYLLYITGISFYLDEKSNQTKFRTWGNKESETFKIIEEMCQKGDSTLIYYSPINKKYYLKSSEGALTIVDSLIKFSNNIKSVIVENNINNYEKVKEEEKYNIKINRLISKDKKKFERIRPKKDDSETFFDNQDYSKIRLNKIPVDTNVFGVCDNPNQEDFKFHNLFIGFKKNNLKYLCLKEGNKKRKIYELNKSSILEKDLNLYDLISKQKIDKCYYMDVKDK